MNAHALLIGQPVKMLNNLLRWLDEAAEVATSKDFDVDRFLELRLTVDQFSLVRQIQSACDAAKLMGARLAQVDAPKHEDTETTVAAIRDRIGATIAFLEGIASGQLEGWTDRKITLPFLPEGKWMRGEEYANDFALPNFYFHLTTAYALLRSHGVKLGKRAFIGSVNLQDP